MTYRLLGSADAAIEDILTDTARFWGIEAAARYDLLMRTAFQHLGASPATPGAAAVPGLPGWRHYHLRLVRTQAPTSQRVGRPRHVVIYRIGGDGVTEIAGVVHDRMLLVRAARHLFRGATSD